MNSTLYDLTVTDPSARGGILKRWRSILGWADAEAARHLGVDVEAIEAWEIGKSVIPIESWERLASAVQLEGDQRNDVVVLMAGDRKSVLDVVTGQSYMDHMIAADGRSAVVSSVYQDARSGNRELSHQLFDSSSNAQGTAILAEWKRSKTTSGAEEQKQEQDANRYFMRRVLERHLRRELVQLLLLEAQCAAQSKELM